MGRSELCEEIAPQSMPPAFNLGRITLAGRTMAWQQAQFFLKTANPQPGDLLVLDFEQPPNGAPPMTADQARAFVQVVHSAIGVWPGILRFAELPHGKYRRRA